MVVALQSGASPPPTVPTAQRNPRPHGRDRRLPGDDAQTRWIGRGGVTVLDHALNVSYADISVMLGLALVILWLWLRGRNLRDLLAQAALTVSGYFRPRPDRAMERALRSAFTQLDLE